MEDVLEVYQRPHDPEYPLVCLDETSKQLIAETRVPIPAKPGQPVRCDYEYERNGTANLFMMFAPLEGWRHVEVTDRHTAVDYAKVLKDLSDTQFRKAKKITLVQDNLNIHKPASLYEAFPAAEARRLVERFEWHFTPKHGSWMNMAESELSVLSGQCLDRRIADKQTLVEEVAAWQHSRNNNHVKTDWQFTPPPTLLRTRHQRTTRPVAPRATSASPPRFSAPALLPLFPPLPFSAPPPPFSFLPPPPFFFSLFLLSLLPLSSSPFPPFPSPSRSFPSSLPLRLPFLPVRLSPPSPPRPVEAASAFEVSFHIHRLRSTDTPDHLLARSITLSSPTTCRRAAGWRRPAPMVEQFPQAIGCMCTLYSSPAAHRPAGLISDSQHVV